MYCPDCGAETNERRNYCKYCGGAMSGSSASTDNAVVFKPTALAWVTALFTVLFGLGGLAAVFTTAYHLAQRPGLDEGVPIVLMVFGSASVVAIVSLLVHLTLKLGGTTVHSKPSERKVIPRRETNPVQRLPESPSAIASVTEHTTRTFEHAERGLNAQERLTEKSNTE